MLPLLTQLQARRAAHRRTKAPTTGFAAMLLVVPLADGYTVERGDTVWDIAQQLGSTVGRIVEANRLPADGELVHPGDVLTIPSAHGPGGAAKPRSGNTDRASSAASGRADPDERRIVVHTVEPGDTISELATHYHAWSAELVEANGGSTDLRVGQELKVPVVVAAEQRAQRGAGPSGEADRRAAVRRLITRTAREHGVDPDLALAVSWQESGWQQDVVSRADAVGVMQVMPSTGRWLSEVTGRDLDLRDLEDNVYAGVVLLQFLTDRENTRRALAGYYQGLESVETNGMYDDTERYIANVRALRRDFERGNHPY